MFDVGSILILPPWNKAYPLNWTKCLDYIHISVAACGWFSSRPVIRRAMHSTRARHEAFARFSISFRLIAHLYYRKAAQDLVPEKEHTYLSWDQCQSTTVAGRELRALPFPAQNSVRPPCTLDVYHYAYQTTTRQQLQRSTNL